MEAIVKEKFLKPHILLIVVSLLILTACERPVPREDTPTDVVDPAPAGDVIVIPTAPPEVNDAYPADAVDQPGEETTDPAVTEETTDTGDTAVTTEESTESTTETTDTTAEQNIVADGGEVVHVVQAGETLGYIAQLYAVSLADLVAANNIGNVDVLEVGQELIVKAGATAATPADTETPDETGNEQEHVVQSGENLFRIGLRYGFTAEELAAYNNIPDITRIDVGQIIKIPPK
jgi:LysM repeat protein